MAFRLRDLLREGWTRVFREHSVADIEVRDSLLEMRMHCILTQIVAHRALVQALAETAQPGAPFDPPRSLWFAIRRAETVGIIDRRQVGVLEAVNRMSNAAKHELGFRAAL